MLKVIHVCWADDKGGAFIGARRLHQAFLKDPRFDSSLLVLHKFTQNIEKIKRIQRSRFTRKLYSTISGLLRKAVKSDNQITRSFNIVPTGLAGQINALRPDIVQFHWVGNDTISLWEIPWLEAPVVWKLPDMWPFSGSAHYPLPGFEDWYSHEENIRDKLPYDSGLNVEKYMTLLKRIILRNANINFVGPSRWITDLVSESYLFKGRPSTHIINPINSEIWRKSKSHLARSNYDISDDDFVILFSSIDALGDPRKGYQHLENIFSELALMTLPKNLKCAVIGHEGASYNVHGIKCVPLGRTFDEKALSELYNIGDLFVFPSIMDNLANTIKEATCCGLPCVAFNIGGNGDMIRDGVNGFLIKPFDTKDFAIKIAQLMKMDSKEFNAISAKTEEMAHALHSESTATEHYHKFYNKILGSI
ncbi:MAG: glycosyltransferase [Pseudomonadota bacterium]|nr:glycosyltransferase [Pseudomonadota bacterium]